MFNIKIYLSNLLLTNLEKYHFGEIVASTWDEQIIKYCKTYKIKLM
jgi:hypothetical protein